MKEKINTYFAILIITVSGAGASLIILHVASTIPTSAFAAEASS